MLPYYGNPSTANPQTMKHLSILCLVIAFVGVTSFTLLQPSPQPTKAQLTRIGLKGATLKELRPGIWAATQRGKAVGHVVNSQYFAQDVRGFHGETPLLVYINKQRVVSYVTALPNDETPDFFNTALPLLKKYQKQKASHAATLKVDAVTGATYSSKGLIGNMQAALKAYNTYVK